MAAIEPDPNQHATIVRLKAVPGASRDQIAGLLGDRLKIRVAAAPEGGKANKAICALIAARCAVRTQDVRVIAGTASPLKSVRIEGLDAADARARLLGPGV